MIAFLFLMSPVVGLICADYLKKPFVSTILLCFIFPIIYPALLIWMCVGRSARAKAVTVGEVVTPRDKNDKYFNRVGVVIESYEKAVVVTFEDGKAKLYDKVALDIMFKP